MDRISFKPGNMVYPVPAVMVSCGKYGEQSNIVTAAWTGTVCSDPPMAYVSLRPERYSYNMIEETGEYVINLVTEDLVRAMDYCGVRSGRDVDKWKECGLTPVPSETVNCPAIAESPVNIECRVTQKLELGSHHMFLAEVTAVRVDGKYMDAKGAFDLNASRLLAYSHGTYFGLGKRLGTFGYSVRKTKTGRPKRKK